MQNQIISTAYTLPLTYLNNGSTAGQWVNPQYLLLQDDLTAESSPAQGATCDVIVGNFNFNIPSGAVITGIQFKVRGYVGAITSPPASLAFSAYNNLPTVPEYYPYTAPFTGFTQSIAEYVFGSPTYLFNRAWTVDEINNFKLQLLGSGDIFIDDVQAQVFYYIPSSVTPPTPPSDFCLNCEGPIQGVEYFLAIELTATDTKAYVYNFNYANGQPIQITDLGDCGGVIEVVLDEGKIATNGSNFMENAAITNITRLPSGLIELDFGSLTNRGLGFKSPWTHDSTLVGPHSINAKLIISNSAPYEAKKLRQCQLGYVFSGPVSLQFNGSNIVSPITKFNFTGAVVVTPDSDPTKGNIFIPGVGTTPPVVVSISSATSGNVQVPDLTWNHTSLGVNRDLKVEVSLEGGKTVTGITFNGVPLVFTVSAELNAVRSEIWNLVAPPVGTYPIVVTYSANTYCSAGTESLVGVDQSTPLGNTQSATGTDMNPILVLTTAYDNSILIDALSTAQTPILYTPGLGQVASWVHNAATDTRQGGSSEIGSGTSPDAVTMQYNITQSTDWAYCAVEIKGLTSAPPVVTGVTVQDTTPNVVIPNVTKLVFPDGVLTNPALGEADINTTLIKARGTDTTPGYLDPKLNIHSSDASVTVTKTITNPSGNEVIDYDLSSPLAQVIKNTVNADETLGGVITTNISAPDLAYAGIFNANSLYVDNSGTSGFAVALSGYTNGITTWAGLNYGIAASAPGKKIRLRAMIAMQGTDVSHFFCFGFSDTVTSVSPTAFADKTFRFVMAGSSVYAVTSDSVAATSTVLSGISAGTAGVAIPHTYEIVWNPGTDVKYYVDGILLATHTTNIPTSNTGVKLVSSAPSTGVNGFIQGIVMSQEY